MGRQSPPGLSFRPDIQGLRALAVAIVVVAHLGGLGLPGGYVGVDVFFVVSGFLITALLLRDVERFGRVSLRDFYARRARRILPAATVVVLATLVGSVLLLPLTRAQTVMVDSVWTAIFAGNVRFAMVGTDYFAQGDPPSPLQHYWSLAVEEQFYLVWPLLVAGWAWWWVRRGRPGGTRALAGVLGVLALASLAWSWHATGTSPTTAYFSTFARGWELAVGAGCALLLRSGRFALPRVAREALALGGLAAVAWAAWSLSPSTPFPGLVALVPVLGTAALLVAGGAGAAPTVVGRILSVGPAVRVGDWSYSLYLWHWPVIVLFRGHFGPAALDLPAKVGLLGLVVLLSWLTYRYVETPFRSGRTWRPRLRALAIYPASLALVAVAAGAGQATIAQRLGSWSDAPAIQADDYRGETRADDPFVALVEASVLAAEEGRAVPGGLRPGLVGLRQAVAPLGDCDYRTGTRELCQEGDPEGERAIVVLGDSHARAWSPAIHEIGRTQGFRTYTLVYSGCIASGLVQVDRETGRPWTECEEFKSWALEAIDELDPALVVVSTSTGRLVDPVGGEVLGPNAPLPRYRPLLQEAYRSQLEALVPLADRVVVLGNTPRLPRETGVCLSQGSPDLGDCLFPAGPRAEKFATTAFRAARDAGASSVDAKDWFCTDQGCPAVVGDFITMRDKEHITPDYATWLAEPLAGALGLTGGSTG
ncbi:acyltransferase family protein [Nocardioides campestrisoli]|uniref:acyltransferase family protein n=1 Tax=Nocardioides campestrisoli TaxID=2736757 RepID=UPI00163D84F6|nr:acyltransferase family protein [Nocardioides campestrisoli]